MKPSDEHLVLRAFNILDFCSSIQSWETFVGKAGESFFIGTCQSDLYLTTLGLCKNWPCSRWTVSHCRWTVTVNLVSKFSHKELWVSRGLWVNAAKPRFTSCSRNSSKVDQMWNSKRTTLTYDVKWLIVTLVGLHLTIISLLINYLRQGGNVFTRVCLSVCLAGWLSVRLSVRPSVCLLAR